MSIIPVARGTAISGRIAHIAAGLFTTSGGAVFGTSADGRIGGVSMSQTANRSMSIQRRYSYRQSGYRLWLLWSVAVTGTGNFEMELMFDRITIPGLSGNTIIYGPTAIGPVDGIATSVEQRTSLVTINPLDGELYNIRLIRTATGGIDTFAQAVVVHALEEEPL